MWRKTGRNFEGRRGERAHALRQRRHAGSPSSGGWGDWSDKDCGATHRRAASQAPAPSHRGSALGPCSKRSAEQEESGTSKERLNHAALPKEPNLELTRPAAKSQDTGKQLNCTKT